MPEKKRKKKKEDFQVIPETEDVLLPNQIKSQPFKFSSTAEGASAKTFQIGGCSSEAGILGPTGSGRGSLMAFS